MPFLFSADEIKHLFLKEKSSFSNLSWNMTCMKCQGILFTEFFFCKENEKILKKLYCKMKWNSYPDKKARKLQ